MIYKASERTEILLFNSCELKNNIVTMSLIQKNNKIVCFQ